MKIYATDVDDDALAQARHGVYRRERRRGVPPELREKYFERDGRSATCSARICGARSSSAATISMQDAPISRVDLLACRNTLMYFNAETQAKILARFHFALDDDGFCSSRQAETLITHADLFAPLDLKRRIFAQGDPANARATACASLARATARERRAPTEADALRDGGLRHRRVRADRRRRARRAGAWPTTARAAIFGLRRADIGRPLQDLEISYRPLELRSRIENVLASARPVRATVASSGDVRRTLAVFDVSSSPARSTDGADDGAGIAFPTVTRHRRSRTSSTDPHRAGDRVRGAAVDDEELETTNEELQSTVEELETTNEELQSTNEELETMNEELQSTNEELETMNDELRQRTDELNDVNLFLEAILSCLQSAVIVVDRDMTVTRWNRHSYELWGLREDEVCGAHLMNLDIGLPLEKLRQPIRDVLGGESDVELSFAAVNRRGRAVRCDVRATALQRPDRQIVGAILLMDVVEASDD